MAQHRNLTHRIVLILALLVITSLACSLPFWGPPESPPEKPSPPYRTPELREILKPAWIVSVRAIPARSARCPTMS